MPHIGVKIRQLLLQPLERRLVPRTQASGGCTQPVVLRRQQLDGLASARRECAQLLHLGFEQQPGGRPYRPSTMRQRSGSQCIGLGQAPSRFGKVSGLAGRDHCHVQASGRQGDRYE